MASSKNAILRQNYTDLAKSEKSGDFERALKACNRILKSHPHEFVAFKCKLVCLIQLSQFEPALALLKKSQPKLTADCTFERAYCEYRLNKTEDALKTMESLGEPMGLKALELYAQLLYRQGRFKECQQIYKKLLKESQDDMDELRGANLQAVEVQLVGKVESGVSVAKATSPGSYEQVYNEACANVASGNYQKAMKLLEKSEKKCREILAEDGYQEDEIEDEVALMQAQKAYCEQMLGNLEKSVNIYQAIIKQKPSDPVLLAVASNNLVSLKKGEQNLFDTRKKLKTCQGFSLEQKLSPAQKRVICFNHALLQLHSNQYDLCKKALAELKTVYEADQEAVLIEASLLARQKDNAKAVQVLNSFKEKNETSNSETPIEIEFALAQLEITDSQAKNALKELRNGIGDPNIKWSPALLSLLVSLHMAVNEEENALKLLAEAVDYYKEHMPTSARMPVLVEECASLHANLGHQTQASAYLEDLRQMRPNDEKVLARLIQAYSQIDTNKAADVSKSLPLMDMKVEDVESLESSEWILLGERYKQKKEAKQTPIPGQDLDQLRAKRKRKRKLRLPKNYDPNIPPDPERWLPKHERSTFKKRKGKAAKDQIGKGTQGAVLSGPEGDKPPAIAMDVGASPKSASAKQVPEGPRQQRPAGAQPNKQKKKKKVAGKW